MPPRDDPWYAEERSEVDDLFDISWANRRRYASGRLRRPEQLAETNGWPLKAADLTSWRPSSASF